MVCDWLATFGMQQYRKKFLHNLVSGKLLIRLTEAHFKADIGIGPLGHRTLILDTIQELLQKQAAQQQQQEAGEGGGQEGGSSRRGRPSSAPVTRRPRSVARRSPSPATVRGGEAGREALRVVVWVDSSNKGLLDTVNKVSAPWHSG
jgi:hypothetical protein